jgi:hydrogenase maturation protease
MVLAVIGIGSRAARDDAVGLDLVDRLVGAGPDQRVSIHRWEDADALSVTHDLLALDRPALIVDCAAMGLAAGEHRLVAADAIPATGLFATASTHGVGMAEALALARALGYDHAVHVFGVQPFDVSQGIGLTPAMEACLPELSRALGRAVAALATARGAARVAEGA